MKHENTDVQELTTLSSNTAEMDIPMQRRAKQELRSTWGFTGARTEQVTEKLDLWEGEGERRDWKRSLSLSVASYLARLNLSWLCKSVGVHLLFPTKVMAPWFDIHQHQLFCAQSRISTDDGKGNIWHGLETLLFIDSWKYHCFLTLQVISQEVVCLTEWEVWEETGYSGHTVGWFHPLPVWCLCHVCKVRHFL